MKAASILAFIMSFGAAFPSFGASINVGAFTVSQDTAAFQIPVRITGATNEFATDMAAIVQMSSALPSSPLITAISYTNAIWTNASGGYLAFASYQLTNNLYDPNVSLMNPGQRVPLTNGLLFTLSASVAGLPPGEYPIRLAGVVLAGNTNATRIKNGAADVSLNITNGVLVVRPR